MSTPKPREALLERVLAYLAAHGVGDTSLRTLASEVGTSHRMLIYHFGSREGLLAAMVERTWQVQQARLDELTLGTEEPYDVAWRLFWSQLADDEVYTPLFFEMAAAAMQGQAWAGSLHEAIASWTEQLVRFFADAGQPADRAELLGRTAAALARGVLFELALTGDRATADATIAHFLDSALLSA